MAIDLGKGYVQIVPSAKGISGSISKELNGEASSAGVAAGGKIGAGVKTALVAAGIGIALKETIMQGAKLEQSIGGVETLFKNSAGKIKKYAINAWQTAGVSANNYMEMATSFSASLLQSLNGDTNKAAKITDMAIRDMSDNANKMGTDMQMIQDTYQSLARGNYMMLDNLKLGYGGTKGEMERLLADAQKLTGVKYDISNLSDVYEAIHVIQGELGITGTTAKEAETTILGSFNAMKASAQNLLGQLVTGGSLESVQKTMSNLITSTCTFLFKNLVPALGRVILSLPLAIGTFIEQGIPMLFTEGGKMMESIIYGYKAKMPEMLEAIPSFIGNILAKLQASLPRILEGAGRLVTELGMAIIDNLPKLYTMMGSVVEMLSQWFENNSGKIAEKGGQLVAKLAIYMVKNLPKIIGAMAKLGLVIIKALIKLPPQMFKMAVKMIASFVKGIVPESVKRKFNKVKNAITKPIETAKNLIKRAVDKIKGFFDITLKFKGIKLPHISISYSKDGALASIAKKLGLEGVPKFSVKWYGKGGIFDRPTIAGIGEAGREAVVPLDPFWAKMDAFTEKANRPINLTININQPVKSPIETARAVKRELQMGLAGVTI